MKKRVIHVASVTILTIALGFSVKSAFAVDPLPSKQIDDTVCCKDGKRTGSSNDCIRGSGSCIDGKCPNGTTESSVADFCKAP